MCFAEDLSSVPDSKHFFGLLTSLTSVSKPVMKSEGGFHYLYEADCPSKQQGELSAYENGIILYNINCCVVFELISRLES